MAEFCNKECEDMGSICDFCVHYKDEYRDIQETGNFSGDGICSLDGSEVECTDGYNCDNFKCFRVK